MPSSLAPLFTFACFSGATAVALGAFGAHGLKGRLSPNQLASWNTATQYQLIHSVALLFATSGATAAAALPPTGAAKVAAWSFAAGITCFSGSIYGLCLTKEGAAIRKVLGPVTPLGGLAFMAGWVALGLSRRGGGAPRLR